MGGSGGGGNSEGTIGRYEYMKLNLFFAQSLLLVFTDVQVN